MDPYDWGGDGFGEVSDEEQKFMNSIPLVVHIGSRFVRLGFSGVCTPHLVVSAPFLRTEGPAKLPILPAATATATAATAAAAAATAASASPALSKEQESTTTPSSSSSSSSKVRVLELAEEPLLEHQLSNWLGALLGASAARILRERPVLLVEGPLNPPYLKHKIVQLLLNLFQVNPKP